MSSSKNVKIKPQQFNILITFGIVCIAISFTILVATYMPVFYEEVRYGASQVIPVSTNTITPIDPNFGIIIPKIGANSTIIPEVDPFDSHDYQRALTKGVAHAKGTGYPGFNGNIFLFSHSSVNFYEASRYNSVFYLLTKIDMGDTIELWYMGTKYQYVVTEKKFVSPTSVTYLKPLETGRETVTLMTCWPPGTTYKRLLTIAERTE